MDIDSSFIEKYTPLIKNNICKYSKYYGTLNSYEDFFNTALLVIYNNIEKFDQTKCKVSLEGFLSTKIRQKIIDLIRSETKTNSQNKVKKVHISFSSPELDVLTNQLPDETNYIKEVEHKEIVSILLKELNENQAEVINTLFFKDEEAVSLAKSRNVTEAAISFTKKAAFRKMRAKLESMEIYSTV